MEAALALHRLALALWIGGVALFTFVVTPLLFRSRGRDQAGAIVGVIFPAYFRYGAVLGIAALAARGLAPAAFEGPFVAVGTGILLAMTLASAVQARLLTPAMERVKQAIPSFQDTPADDPDRRRFARLHGLSMALNLAVLLAGAALVAGSRYLGG